jgi:hypothetical protein
MAIVGCSGNDDETEEPLDPADILGAAQSAVIVELNGASKAAIEEAIDLEQQLSA